MNHALRAFALAFAALLSFPAQPAEFRQISQIIDSSGNPVVNGYIYVGTYALDPVTNPISLFSDSGLTTPIANPVRTDSFGRPTTDVFFAAAQYSYQLKTAALVSIEGPKNRDAIPTAASVASNQASTATSCGTFGGSANALTCTLSPAITAYTDLMTLRGRTASDNTTAVTINVNGVGAKNIVKWDGTALAAGDLQQNDTVTIVFDTPNNRFQLNSPNAAVTIAGASTISGDKTFSGTTTFTGTANMSAKAFNEAVRVDVASAATINVDSAAANYVRITGTTGTTAITLTDGRNRRLVVGSDGWTITTGASLIAEGFASGAVITFAAGETFEADGEASSVVRLRGIETVKLLSTTTASASATVDIALTTGFTHYELVWEGVQPATDNAFLWLRVSIDGGGSYAAGASDYSYVSFAYDFTGASTVSGSTGDTKILLNQNTGSDTDAATSNYAGKINIFNPRGGTFHKGVDWSSVYKRSDAAGNNYNKADGSGFYIGAATALTHVRLLMSTGNVESGAFKLYGRR